MEREVADSLIRDGQNIVYITMMDGNLLAAHTRYNRDFTDQCHFIPSWRWDKVLGHFLVHYLDLPTLESVAFNAGYTVKYAPGCEVELKNLRNEYLGRRDIKKGGIDKDNLADLVHGTGVLLEEVASKRPLRRYQTVGANFMFRCKKVLNADGMGAGKTAQAIGAVILNKDNGRPYKTLVICPASVKEAWSREFDAMTDMKVLSMPRSLDKRYEVYARLPQDQQDVLIITYEGFLADYEEIARVFNPDILVVDECHRLCNRTNKITQALIGGRNVKKTFPAMVMPHSIFLLTGTPISNKLEDLYSLLKLMDANLFSWSGFTNRYTIMEQFGKWDHSGGAKKRRFYTKIVDYKHEKELKAKVSLHMIRRTKDEVLPELPPKVFQTIEVELGNEERKIYNELRKNYRTMIRGKELSVPDHLTWMMRAQQITDSLEIVPGSNAKRSSKLEELVRICNEQAPARKIVVFSRFKSMTKIICRELAHLKPIHLNGDVPTEDRQGLVDAFQNDPKHRVFVSTYGAGGVGITLTAADLCIQYDAWFSPSAMTQSADRLHRMGQKNSVLVVKLRVKDTIEEHIDQLWLTKQAMVQDMVGDEKVLGALTRKELEKLI